MIQQTENIWDRKRWTGILAAAQELGLPADWLCSEVECGKLPCLRIEDRVFVNVDQIHAAALALAASPRCPSTESRPRKIRAAAIVRAGRKEP